MEEETCPQAHRRDSLYYQQLRVLATYQHGIRLSCVHTLRQKQGIIYVGEYKSKKRSVSKRFAGLHLIAFNIVHTQIDLLFSSLALFVSYTGHVLVPRSTEVQNKNTLRCKHQYFILGQNHVRDVFYKNKSRGYKSRVRLDRVGGCASS